MRGGFLHNQVLIPPIENHFERLGAHVAREYPTGEGRQVGFVDLFVEHGAWRISCEAELTAHRIENDLEKAAALHASLLLIVVPEPRVARAVRRRVVACDSEQKRLPIWILPLGPMLQRLAHCFPLISAMNVPESKERKTKAPLVVQPW